jgi:hypothetical protein
MILLLTNLKTMKWAGHVARMERREMRTVLVGKLEEKRPLGKRRFGSENNYKIKHKETEYEGVDWSYLAEDRDR